MSLSYAGGLGTSARVLIVAEPGPDDGALTDSTDRSPEALSACCRAAVTIDSAVNGAADNAEDDKLLLDELMPVFDVAERHRTIVAAPPERVFAAVRTADLGGGSLTRALMAIRVLPAALVALARSPRAAFSELRARRAGDHRGLRLADFERAGFSVVAERAPEELVIGLLGKFWTPRGGLCASLTAVQFAAGPPPGHALAGWNFTVTPLPDGRSELRTETRVLCAPDARLKFRAYWLLVSTGSALIRHEMLAAIRREAERAGGA